MDGTLQTLKRAWLANGDPEARERYRAEQARHGELRAVDLPWTAEVLTPRLRLERLGPAQLWLDPLVDQAPDWKPPLLDLEVVGRTPHPCGLVYAPGGVPWLARPLRTTDGERVLASVAEGRVAGLALSPEHGALPDRLQGEGLRALVLSDCRALDPALLGRLPRLTHLSLRGADPRWLAAAARLPGLVHLELTNSELGDLGPLGALGDLQSLSISACRLSSSDLWELSDLALESLALVRLEGLSTADLDALPDSLRDLDLSGSKLGDDLPDLERLERLVCLDLAGVASEEAILERLPGGLETLGLSTPGFAAFDGLARFTSLRRLDLSQGLFSSRRVDLSPLSGLQQLSELSLEGARNEGEDDFAPLAELRALRTLNLEGCADLTGGGLRHAPGLTRLRLFSCYRLSRDGVRAVAGLPALEELSLAQCRNLYGEEHLDEEGLEALGAAPSLKRLDLSANSLSPLAIPALRERLPECHVRANGRASSLEVLRAIRDAEGDPDPIAALAALGARWPDSPEVVRAQVAAAAATGDGDATTALLTRRLELEPAPEVYEERGWVLWQTGSPVAAVPDFTRALELDPERHHLYLYRAEAHAQAGDDAAAIADYGRLLELGAEGRTTAQVWGQYVAALYTNRAGVRLRAGELEDVLADCERAIGVDPEASQGYANRAYALVELGRPEEARAQFLLALERNPEDASLKRGLAALDEG